MAFFNAHDFAVEICQSLQSAIDLDLVLGRDPRRSEDGHSKRWSRISFASRPRSSARSDTNVSFHSRLKSAKGDIEERIDPVDYEDEKFAKPGSRGVSVKIQEDEDKYNHLTQAEADVLKRQIDVPTTNAGWKVLYRYATTNDKLILAISFICAVASGAAIPLMTVIYGGLADKFKDFFTGALSRSAFSDEIAHQVLYLVYIGAAEFVTIYISTVGFMYTGEHIAGKVRAQYLDACLRQNIGFFDEMGAGEITTRITADMNMVQDGISEKVALTLNALSTFVTAFVISFVKSWKLTLILTASCVAITLVVAIGSSINIKYKKEALQSYASGGTVAEEAISSIRNAVAFGTQDKLARQYEKYLTEAEYYGFKEKRIFAVALGGMNLIIYLNYGLAFWVSSRFLINGEIALSSILTILMSVMMGAFALGNVAPNVQAFTTAISAASKIFSTIDRESPLDPTSTAGEKLDHVKGTIEIRHIKHIYPSRPEVVVMNDVSLKIPAGKTTALVGASGSGKSTIVGLVERFYDPVSGEVFLDGRDIRTLNLRWLRQQMALVSQEPVLFDTTILDNIAYGLIGSKYEHEKGHARMRRVVEAAKLANAHEFISELPRGYATNVGQRGSLLSGGQKQRVAIARAIISNPRILLLDEATSALDTKSEGVVQAAIDAAAAGRTTIVIAHRLSTIKDADNIVVMSAGRIVEQGTHEFLLKMRGVYASLVEAQTIAESEELTAEEEIKIDEKDDMLARQHLPGLNLDMLAQPYLPGLSSADEKQAYTEKSNDDHLIRIESAEAYPHLAAPVKEKQYSLWTLIKLIASFNRAEWYWMLLGLAFSIVCGGGNPVQEVFSAKQIVALSRPIYIPNTSFEIPGAANQIRSDVDYWSRLYVMLAVSLLIGYWISGTTFAWCSERLIHRMRSLAFRTILRQDITFFDRKENTAGALTSFLSTETTYIAGLSGVTLGTFLIVVTTLVASVAIALAFAWKLALVCMSTIPVLVGCGFLRFWLISQFQLRAQEVYTKSASFACEATNAIRTVASLTLEFDVLERYEYSLHVQGMSSLLSVMKSSILYAASQSLMFLCIGLGFWYGSNQIADGHYGLFQFFVAFTSVVFGAQAAGTVFSFAPDMGKAKQSAQKLKVLFDQKPVIDCWSEDGEPVKKIKGNIEFRDVHFRYPTRPEQPVLRGLDFSIKPGQYVALVGASGCGKSTSIALLERFYDPLRGGIYVDGKDISKLNINDYRSYVALVSQEPTLYQGTIRENVLLGLGHDDVSDAQIEFACREANIYDFIISLPDGFNTTVGSKGSMLSGGQKQRIAIARALIRDPKILLLDEATSALDSESEYVVQAALDKAAKGRTTIAVAHRLSTIQKADVIHVLDQGVIIESGDHWELMARRGRYFELVNLQSLSEMS